MDKKREAKITKDYIDEAIISSAINNAIQDVSLEKKLDFQEQLGSFYRDNSYEQRFRNIEIFDKVGIEIFKYKPNSKLKSKLLTLDLAGSLTSNSDMSESTHIAKVIKLPSLRDVVNYKVGDLVLLRPSDTVGTDWNPEFIFLMQSSNSNEQPIIPDGLTKRTYKIVARYFDHAFLPPSEYDTPSDKISTFCIPEMMIVGKYNI
jgi:hypothetical protein